MSKQRITRALVIEAAARHVNTFGFASLTLAPIASELGIKIPSLYNHIDGLDGLQAALAGYGAHQLFLRCQDAAIGRGGAEALAAIAEAYRSYIILNAGTYAATLHPQRQPNPELAQANHALMELFERILIPFELSSTDQIHVLRGLRSIVHGFATLEAAGGFGLPIDMNMSFQTIVTGYIANIKRPQRSVPLL
jgi:AcrR family transcriptional regulator